MVYLKYVENVIPLSKFIGLLFLFCLPLLSILFLKTKRNDLARPVMGTIFLVTSRHRECDIEMRQNSKNVCSLYSMWKRFDFSPAEASVRRTPKVLPNP